MTNHLGTYITSLLLIYNNDVNAAFNAFKYQTEINMSNNQTGGKNKKNKNRRNKRSKKVSKRLRK